MAKLTRLLTGPGRQVPQYVGALPEEEISGRLAFRKIPSEEWMKAHPAGVPCEPPGDEDMVVQAVLLGSYGYPSRLKPYHQWDRGQFPVAELAVPVPYLVWKAAGDADIARQKVGEPDPLGEVSEAQVEQPPAEASEHEPKETP